MQYLDDKQSEQVLAAYADDHKKSVPVQVGGHKDLFSVSLRVQDSVDVQVIGKPTNAQECEFYTKVNRDLPEFADKWMPRFYGCVKLPPTSIVEESAKFTHLLVIRDLTSHLDANDRLNVMDVKLGRRHYSDDATTAKREKMIALSESTTSQNFGIRFIGMQVWINDQLMIRDKQWGKQLRTWDDIAAGLRDFTGSNLEVYLKLTTQLEEDFKIMSLKQSRLRLYSASMLWLHRSSGQCQLKLIDFAQSYLDDSNTFDDRCMVGLETINNALREIRIDRS